MQLLPCVPIFCCYLYLHKIKGDLDDCVATSEAAELSAKFSKEKIEDLPVPGQVDFINGGPPCQEYTFTSVHFVLLVLLICLI